jgi:hypothetical protein
MRIFGLGIAVAVMGCATVQPFMPSGAQQARFDEVVREAEAAGINDGPPEAARLLSDAKSDWMYAQHLPKYPERARGVAAKAQRDAETALLMVQRSRARTAGQIASAVQTRPD